MNSNHKPKLDQCDPLSAFIGREKNVIMAGAAAAVIVFAFAREHQLSRCMRQTLHGAQC